MNKRALITRFGGVGDQAPMQVVGMQLKKRGYDVTFAVREDGPAMHISDLFIENPAFDQVLDLRQVGPWNTRCIKSDLGFVSINSVYPDFDLVIDFMNIIECNSTSPYNKDGHGNEWQKSRSSNWRNWYDIHLEWCNIDPHTVSDEEKRPKFNLLKDETVNIDKMKSNFDKLIVMQTTASSLSRTWYQGKNLVEKLIKEYPDSAVAFWDNDRASWFLVCKKGTTLLSIKNSSHLRASMALVGSADLFIGVDSGFTHIAEGLDVKNICIYSTVPWWTRAKYYKHQIPIDLGLNNPEYYTFNLGLGDPLRVIEGIASFNEREKKIWEMYTKGTTVFKAADELNIDVQGAEMELNALLTKKASFERQQSKALSNVSLDLVFGKVKEALNGKN